MEHHLALLLIGESACELRGPSGGQQFFGLDGRARSGRPYLDRALSLCSPDSVSSKILSFTNLQTMADSDFRMAGAITPSRAISLILTTQVSIA